MPSSSERGDGHDVDWHIWSVCILKLKIFGGYFIVFAILKYFVKFQMMHLMQQELLKSMKDWIKYAFSKWKRS